MAQGAASPGMARNLTANESAAFSGVGGAQVPRGALSPEQEAAGRASGRLGFGMPQGPLQTSSPGVGGLGTGSPWESAMATRLGQGTPEDMALRQRMMQAEAQRGMGPQYQGLGRPSWQEANPLESIRRANEMVPGAGRAQAQARPGQSQGALIQAVGQTMGGPSGGGTAPLGAGQRQAAYYASSPGAMGRAWRSNPVPIEQPRWMPRG
jgi:hypothetical protein